MKRSTYYYTISKEVKDFKDDKIMNEIIRIFYDHKERYGYHRVTLELMNQGYNINHKKVLRLMNRMGLHAKNVPVENIPLTKVKLEEYRTTLLHVTFMLIYPIRNGIQM